MARSDSLIGEIVDGKYRVDAVLGRGGMGAVHRATHLGTGREVALKVLVPELTSSDAAVERFKREARAAGQMRHPNVVDVTDFGFAERGTERFAYLVMELLRGRTLRALVEEGPLPLDVAVDVLDQVCAAVAEAHALGILHRDLKPENIQLEPGPRGGYVVKVLDFGIAKLLDASADAPDPDPGPPRPPLVDASAATLPALAGDVSTAPTGAQTPASSSGGPELTALGAAIGTPRYMSPEQWLGRAADVRADVYSLGVIAYEMLAGKPPFVGASGSIATEHAEQRPPPLATRMPDVPPGVAAAIEAALAKDPAGRPASAAAFAAALRAGAETTGGLLRRAIALSVDHYGLFFRRCAIATLPGVVGLALGVASSRLAAAGMVSARLDGIAFAAGITLWLTGHLLIVPVGGLLVPAVADIVAARRPRPAPPAAELGRAALRALPAALVVFLLNWVANMLVRAPAITVARSVGMLADDAARSPAEVGLETALALASAIVASAFMAPFIVAGHAVAVEGSRWLGPLRRSAALTRPLRRTAFGTQLFQYVLSQTLAALLLLALSQLTNLHLLDETGAAHFLVYAVVGAATTPVSVVAAALLYLRAREARGEPLAAIAPPVAPQIG